MAAVTRLGLYGTSAAPYGSFAGKTEFIQAVEVLDEATVTLDLLDSATVTLSLVDEATVTIDLLDSATRTL